MATVQCPSCEAPNEGFIQFCLRCGADIAGSRAQKAAPHPSGAKAVDRIERTASMDLGRSERYDIPDAKYLAGVTSAQLASAWGRLIQIKEDGSEGPSYPLVSDRLTIGRADTDLCFAHDHCMDQLVVTLSHEAGSVRLEPAPALQNGVFFCLREPRKLHHGDLIRLGHQLFCIELIEEMGEDVDDENDPVEHGTALPTGMWAILRQRVRNDQDGFVFPLVDAVTTLGRKGTKLEFNNDPYVSSEHAKITWNGVHVILSDLHSRNGTFLGMTEGRSLTDGDSFLVGQHLFKFRT